MSAFDESAFLTDAFNVDAFDFGTEVAGITGMTIEEYRARRRRLRGRGRISGEGTVPTVPTNK